MSDSCEEWSLERSEVSEQLKRFVAEKKAQAIAAAEADGKYLLPEFKSLFAAAEKGDWQGAYNIYADLHRRIHEQRDRAIIEECIAGARWSPVFEVARVFGQFPGSEEKYLLAFGRDTIASIPRGSIYFGGTDPGRWIITALCKSHVNADPFFTLTQNAVADQGYLRYVRSMYGRRIYIPTEEELTRTFNEYVEDAQRRQKENKLKPGEFLEEVDGKVQVTGQVGVMTINGALTKLIFDKNPDREFYIEESFPLDWMYPHLSPHGLIMRINRQPLAELSDEIVKRDREYWTRYVRPMIGDWLTFETPVAEIAAFVEKVHIRHDFSDFGGDPRFVQNDGAQQIFSKLRSAIGGLYSRRASNAKSPAEYGRMLKEADFAFRQAYALCPRSPEAVFRYANVLILEGRYDESIQMAGTAMNVDSRDANFGTLVAELTKMKERKSGLPSSSDGGA